MNQEDGFRNPEYYFCLYVPINRAWRGGEGAWGEGRGGRGGGVKPGISRYRIEVILPCFVK